MRLESPVMEGDVTIPVRTVKRVIGVLVALGLLAALVFVAMKVIDAVGEEPSTAVPEKVRESGYQSLQLADGRLLIGKVRRADAGFLELRNAHFIQQIQPPAKGKEQPPPQREVRSVSEQLQGPEPDMLINRDQIVSIENLREDSEAVAGIEQPRETPD